MWRGRASAASIASPRTPPHPSPPRTFPTSCPPAEPPRHTPPTPPRPPPPPPPTPPPPRRPPRPRARGPFPPQPPPVASGKITETIYLHSGEVETSAVDLDAGGRAGWNVVFDRTYRSRTLGFTPFGDGWDSSVFAPLPPLPPGALQSPHRPR